MIQDLAVGVAESLKAKGCPIPVILGPEPTTTTTGARERIVLSYVDDTDIAISAAVRRANPMGSASLGLPLNARVFAQSGKAGAMHWEHRTRALRIASSLLVSIDETARGTLRVPYAIGRARWETPADLEASARAPGAVLSIDFTATFTVFETNWAGEAAGEIVITDGLINTTTNVLRG